MRRVVPYLRTFLLYVAVLSGLLGVVSILQYEEASDGLFGMIGAGLVVLLGPACFAAVAILLTIRWALGRFDPETTAKEASVWEPVPRHRSIRAIVLASALGSVPAACVLLAMNYREAGLGRKAMATALYSATFLLGAWTPAFFCLRYDPSGFAATYLAQIVGMVPLARLLQGDLIAQRRREGDRGVLELETDLTTQNLAAALLWLVTDHYAAMGHAPVKHSLGHRRRFLD